MKTLRHPSLLVLFLLLVTLACGSLTPATPLAVSSFQTPTAQTLPTSTFNSVNETPTLENTPAATETNPPPDTQSAPNTLSQPAGPVHHRTSDPIQLDEIHMFDSQNGWAVSQAEVLVTSDGAQTWHEVTPPETASVGSQVQAQGAFLNRLNAWIIFSIDSQIPVDAVVWHTNDAGKTWTASAPLEHQAYGDKVWAEFSALDTIHVWLMVRGVYVGAGTHYTTQFFRTTDGGLTWTPLDGNVGVDYTGLIFADPQNGWLTWQTTGAYASAPPDYAVTSDGAVNWDSRELPPPVDAPDIFNTSPYCEPYQPRTLSANSIRLLVGCFDYYDPPHVFSSYLYTSDDGGSTWKSIRLPDKVQAANDTLYFFDANNALLLGRDIYRSADGGQTWIYVKSVNWDGQFSFIDAQNGWAVARAGDQIALVKTVNGGNSWSEIKPVIGQ